MDLNIALGVNKSHTGNIISSGVPQTWDKTEILLRNNTYFLGLKQMADEYLLFNEGIQTHAAISSNASREEGRIRQTGADQG